MCNLTELVVFLFRATEGHFHVIINLCINTPGNVCVVQWKVCSTVEDIQYSGGIASVQCSVRWRYSISMVEDIQYGRGCSVQGRDIT